MFVVSESVIVA